MYIKLHIILISANFNKDKTMMCGLMTMCRSSLQQYESLLNSREVSPRIICRALHHAFYLVFQFDASLQLLTFTLSASLVSLVFDIHVNMAVVAMRKFRGRDLGVSSEIF